MFSHDFLATFVRRNFAPPYSMLCPCESTSWVRHWTLCDCVNIQCYTFLVMYIDSLYLLVLSFLASTYPKRLWTLPSQADGAVLERETWSTLHMYRIYPIWQGYVTHFIPWKCCLCEALEVHWVLPLAVTWLHSSIDLSWVLEWVIYPARQVYHSYP